MDADLIVPEPDVLVAATCFLIDRDVVPYRFSVASGRGIDSIGATEKLQRAFAAIGRRPEFTGRGADVVGVSDSEWWAIECKGSGTGQAPTHRNNFDRALASVVSYYEDGPPAEVGARYANARVYLGLALPRATGYVNELRKRVRSPLRMRLNLWVLLYDPTSQELMAVPPQEAV
jgi:hypothetical protein